MRIFKDNTIIEINMSEEDFFLNPLYLTKGYNIYTGTWPIIEIIPFEILKSQKKNEITTNFDNTLISKTTSYTTTGLISNITINARERDLNNLEKLEKYMIDNSVLDTNFRCFDNSFVQLSLLDIQKIISELIAFGLYLHQVKWSLEALIDSIIIDTEENRTAIQNITWSY